MANIILAFDPDDGHRQAIMRAAEERVGLLARLRLGAAGCGSLGVTWAAGPQAPISTDRLADRLSVLWGEAIPGPGPERLDAAALAQAWGLERAGTPRPFSGFHAGLFSDGSRRVRLGASSGCSPSTIGIRVRFSSRVPVRSSPATIRSSGWRYPGRAWPGSC